MRYFGVLVVAGWLALPAVAQEERKAREAPRFPKPLLVDERLGRIDLIVRDRDDVLVLGLTGMARIGPAGAIEVKEFPPAPLSGGIVATDLDGNPDTPEFVRFTSNFGQGTALVDAFDRAGTRLWAYRPMFTGQTKQNACQVYAAIPGRTAAGARCVRITSRGFDEAIVLDAKGKAIGSEAWVHPNESSSLRVFPLGNGDFGYLWAHEGQIERRRADGALDWRVDLSTDEFWVFTSMLRELTPRDGHRRWLAIASKKSHRELVPGNFHYTLTETAPGKVAVEEVDINDVLYAIGGVDVTPLGDYRLVCGLPDDFVTLVAFDPANREAARLRLGESREYGVEGHPKARALLASPCPDGSYDIYAGAGHGLWKLKDRDLGIGPPAKP